MTPMPPRVAGCPADQVLEQLLAGEALAAERRGHVDTCAHCAARLEWMREVDRHFTSAVFPRTREAMVERVTAPRWRLPRLWVWLVPAAVVAAALVLLVVSWRTPPPDYIGLKGGSGGEGTFEVYLGENGHGRRLAEGESVRPGDGLRFVVQAPSRAAFVLSVDSAGNVSRLYPSTGDAAGPAEGLLPGGAILDEVAGPERLFAVYPRSEDPPLRFEDVEAAARRAFGGRGPEGVREVERLPLDVPQDTLLLEKVPR